MSKLPVSVRRSAVVLLVAGLAACRGDDTQRPAKPSTLSSSLASLPVPPPLPGDNDPAPPSPAPLPDNLSLQERLAREASSRPDGAVRTEELVAALKAKGVPVTRTRQVLGRTLNARYCGIAVTEAGLVASVCEFDTATAALAAAKDSEQRFGAAMPNRRFVTNGKSLLTLANLRGSVEPEARAIAATFAALHSS